MGVLEGDIIGDTRTLEMMQNRSKHSSNVGRSGPFRGTTVEVTMFSRRWRSVKKVVSSCPHASTLYRDSLSLFITAIITVCRNLTLCLVSAAVVQ